jgi:hypothetical protein
MRLSIYRNDACPPRARWQNAQGASKNGFIEAPDPNIMQLEMRDANWNRLEINDNYAPGWRAYDGGRSIDIGSTAQGFMSLQLDSGVTPRPIRLVFAPQSFRFGLFLSLCALGATIAIFVATKKPETK